MRVIVTRPEREARAWVAALNRHGLDAIALPLIAIRPVTNMNAMGVAWKQLGGYAAVMFVSGYAVEHFFALRGTDDPTFGAGLAVGTRAWVTGPGTAAALRRCGVDARCIDAPSPESGQFDSEALWDLVAASVRAGDRILIVRGSDLGAGQAPGVSDGPAGPGHGRDWLAQCLRQAGAQVEFVVAYERSVPSFGPAQSAVARAAAWDRSLWLFTSARAVANLALCLPGQAWAGARALSTHARITRAARAAGFGVVWESRPGISDVVASIESIA